MKKKVVDSKNTVELDCYALVTMFGKWRRCQVTAYGEPQERYSSEQTLWVERGEDEYAIPHYSPPFCVLTREAWLQAGRNEVAENSAATDCSQIKTVKQAMNKRFYYLQCIEKLSARIEKLEGALKRISWFVEHDKFSRISKPTAEAKIAIQALEKP